MSNIAIITGAAGLVGSECVRFFSGHNLQCVGIDNDQRQVFFGPEASTDWNRLLLQEGIQDYTHHDLDIRNAPAIESIFAQYAGAIRLVIHTAAQPSHDWAVREPLTDFTINATATLHLLELTRQYCPDAPFIFTSTNKVYGDRPNSLPLIEQETRWEIDPAHPYAAHGIDEQLNVDQSLHSLFGVSKTAADLLVQEYGRYFGLRTACFRCGCITGPRHSGAQLHGFLAYLARCTVKGTPYVVFGYQGKQVRDNIHAADLAAAFYEFYLHPRQGEVYNMGGGRDNNCSVREAIALCEQAVGKALPTTYQPQPRVGDHIWYISDLRKFQTHFPAWHQRHNLRSTIQQILEAQQLRVR
jgi:CDP-paratose 2-epimerase